MFILKDEIKAWWPVKVKEPDEKSAGRFIEYKFEVEFTLMDLDDAERRDGERADILQGDGKPVEIVSALNAFDTELYLDVISDWRSIYDADKKEVPFSRDMLTLALKRPLIRQAVAVAYQEMASGEIRKKN